MANNRLWIVDRSTGERMLLAKSGGRGWCLHCSPTELDEWLSGEGGEDFAARDAGASLGGGRERTTLMLVDENHEKEGNPNG